LDCDNSADSRRDRGVEIRGLQDAAATTAEKGRNARACAVNSVATRLWRALLV